MVTLTFGVICVSLSVCRLCPYFHSGNHKVWFEVWCSEIAKECMKTSIEMDKLSYKTLNMGDCVKNYFVIYRFMLCVCQQGRVTNAWLNQLSTTLRTRFTNFHSVSSVVNLIICYTLSTHPLPTTPFVT